MSKRIVVLNGSPRPQGSTAAMIKAFREAIEANGHEVESSAPPFRMPAAAMPA